MNILIPSIGRRKYLIEYYRNALHRNGVSGRIIVCNRTISQAFPAADKAYISPLIASEEYFPFLMNICKTEEIDLIVPIFDIDLPILSARKSELAEQGVTVLVSDPESIMACNDKLATFKRLNELGITTPMTWGSIEEAMSAIESGQYSFPLIVKPRFGMGSLGVYKVYDEEELRVMSRRLRREIQNSYLKDCGLETNKLSEEASKCYDSAVIQEFVPGEEYGADILNDLNGKLAGCVVKRKVAMRAGETDMAYTVDSSKFEEIIHKISESLRHIGNIDVDFIIDSEGKIYVLEINARFGGQYPSSHISGVDYPTQIIAWLTGGKNESCLLTPEIGVWSCKQLAPERIEKGSAPVH